MDDILHSHHAGVIVAMPTVSGLGHGCHPQFNLNMTLIFATSLISTKT